MVDLVIGLLGEIGGGKTTLADYLVRTYGAFSISSGTLVRAELNAEGISPTREACQKRGGEKGRADSSYWVKKIISAIEDSNAQIGIWDGTRFEHDVALLRDHFGGKYIAIYVTADPRVRFDRLVIRGRKDAPTNYDEFVEQEKGEQAQFNFEATRNLADITFDNTADFDFNSDSLYLRFIDTLRKAGANI